MTNSHIPPYTGGPSAARLAAERESRKSGVAAIYEREMAVVRSYVPPLPPTIRYTIHREGTPPTPTVFDRLIAATLRLNRLETRQEVTRHDAERIRKMLATADSRRAKRDEAGSAKSIERAETALRSVEESL